MSFCESPPWTVFLNTGSVGNPERSAQRRKTFTGTYPADPTYIDLHRSTSTDIDLFRTTSTDINLCRPSETPFIYYKTEVCVPSPSTRQHTDRRTDIFVFLLRLCVVSVWVFFHSFWSVARSYTVRGPMLWLCSTILECLMNNL